MSSSHTDLPTADLAPTGRAKCIHCTQAIAKGSVRIAVLRDIDTGSFVTQGPGYMHPECATAWAETGWEAGLSDLVAKVQAHSALTTLPAPFGSAEGTKAAAAVAAAAAPAATPGEAAPTAPPFGKLTSKQVAALAGKLKNLKDEYKADSAIEKAGLDWNQRDPLRWHLATHGLVPPTHVSVLRRLGETAFSMDAESIFAVLPKLAAKTVQTSDILPSWSMSADNIVLRAMQLDPQRLAGLLPAAPPHLRLGIQLVRGRCGETISQEDRDAVLEGIATVEAKDYGLSRTYSAQGSYLNLSGLGPEGVVQSCYPSSADLAKHFGSYAQWQQALARQAANAKFGSLERVHDGLCAMPLPQLVETLSKPHFSSDDTHYKAMDALLRARQDDPFALADAAQKIERDAYPGGYIREYLLVFAIGQMGQSKLPIPDDLELAPKWESYSFCAAPWRGSACLRANYQRALAALPKTKIHGIIRKYFLRDYGHNYALAILSTAFDDGLLERILSPVKDPNSIDCSACAPLGLGVIPHLLAFKDRQLSQPRSPALDPAEYRKGLRNLDRCVRAALGYVGSVGIPLDSSFDALLSVSDDEDYWQEEDRTAFLHMLDGMTEQRRIAGLRTLLHKTKYKERAFLGVHKVTDASFREEAATLLVKNYSTVNDSSMLQRGIEALGKAGLDSFRRALIEEKPDAKLFQKLGEIFGRAAVSEIQEQANVKAEPPLDRLFRLAQAAPGAKTRVYLLEHAIADDEDDSWRKEDGMVEARRVRPGSFSVSRGKGPTIQRAEPAAKTEPAPPETEAKKKRKRRGADGDEEHILTLDLKEIPELGNYFPGMRALSLFAQSPDHGDGWDDARLEAVPDGSIAPTDGSPVAVLSIDVPAHVFDYDASSKDPVLKEIRSLLFNRPGYALGEPMFIQDEEESFGSGAFLFQLSESLGDLNLGDSGSLYVFSGGSFMQCY